MTDEILIHEGSNATSPAQSKLASETIWLT